MATILAIDSDRSVRQAYRLILTGHHQCLVAETPERALHILDSEPVDTVLLDVNLPGGAGMALLDRLTSGSRKIPVIAVSGLKALGEAVDALKRGARDCLIKPFDVHHLTLVIDRVLEHEQMAQELEQLRAGQVVRLPHLVGTGPAMLDVFDQVKRATATDAPVLLTGRPGTGRSTFAHALHYEGPRANGPFEILPGPDLHTDILRRSRSGTLFIPEITTLTDEALRTLFSDLPDGPRLVFATRHDLRAVTAAGGLPEAVYTRLQARRIDLPPLRERQGDTGALAALFLERHRMRMGSQARHLSAAALDILHDHAWPGNLHELDFVIGQAVSQHDHGEVLDAPALQPFIAPEQQKGAGPRFDGVPLEEATAQLEQWMIGRALDEAGGNQSRAAELLGTTRRVLKYKMDNLGITP